MKDPNAKTISVAELQKQVGTITRSVGYEKQHYILTNRGYAFAAIIPIADYNEFQRLMETHKAAY
jgi:prevent-host-death family protein